MQCVKHLYCDESCRKNAWDSFHQWECLAIQTGFFNQVSFKLHVSLRIAFKAAHTGFPTNQVLKKDFVKQFGDSKSNYPYVMSFTENLNDYYDDEVMGFLIDTVCTVAYLKLQTNFFEQLTLLPCFSKISEGELMHKMGSTVFKTLTKKCFYFVIAYNNNGIDTLQRIDMFKAVAIITCPSAELVQHSCLPNTTHYFVGDTVILKAIKPIKKNEEITTSFVVYSIALLSKERLEVLDQLGIICRCDACTNAKYMAFYICVQCDGPVFATNSFGICTICGCKNVLPQLEEELAIKALFKFILNGNIEDANLCNKIAKTIYKPYHPIFTKLYADLIAYHFKRENVQSVLVIVKQYLQNISLRCQNINTSSPDLLGHVQLDVIVSYVPLIKKMAFKLSKKDLREAVVYVQELIKDLKITFELHNPPLLNLIYQAEDQLQTIVYKYLHGVQQ